MPVLAYGAYLAWLIAGLCDFITHRRSDLPHTSGVAESTAHLVQLTLLAMAMGIGLAFEPGRTSTLWILALVVAHAITGYIDTRIAFAKQRVILPIEQHLHSVLDMAPIVGLAWWVVSTWPAATNAIEGLTLRQQQLPITTWIAVLLPAALLSVLPALLEFTAAWKARGGLSRTPPPTPARTR